MATARTKTTDQPPAETPPGEAPPEYPPWWDWDENGDAVDGTFVRIDRGYTAMGERPFVVLAIDGKERTLWLHWEALRNQFAREVHRRSDKTIHPGEQVKVWRLGSRTSGNGREYFDFRTEFPDGPEQSQADILPRPPDQASAEQPPDDASAKRAGDVPF
jgi:hypothetical protein